MGDESIEISESDNLTLASLFFTFGVPAMLAAANTLGVYIGYAALLALNFNFSSDYSNSITLPAEISNFNYSTASSNVTAFLVSLNATTNTTTGTATNTANHTSPYHPICSAGSTNESANQFALITAVGTSCGFILLTLTLLLFKCAFREPRDNFKKQLKNSAGYAISSNIPGSFLLPAITGFVGFCLPVMGALRLALASGFGSNILMLGFGLCILFGKAGENCCATKKASEQPVSTRVIAVMPLEERRGSLTASVSSQATNSPAVISPAGAPVTTIPNPLSSSTRNGRTHRRSDTQETVPYRTSPPPENHSFS